MISLQPITDENRAVVEALEVAPGQERFVSSVRDSLLEAAREPGAQALAWAVYDGGEPVGFVMVADEVASDEYVPRFLWKLLIDARHQRRGVGTEALGLVVAFFRERGVEEITTSASEGEGSPLPFYERYGFERTGERNGGEVVLRLSLGES